MLDCARADVIVIEDDYAGLTAGADGSAGVVSLSSGRRSWAVVRSLAKSLGPYLRVTLVAGDRTTIERIARQQLVETGWVSTILQALAARLLADPDVRGLVSRAAAVYAERQRTLVRALESHGIAAQGRSGTFVWIPVPKEVGIVRGLLDAGWTVAPGEHFRVASPPGIRVTTSSLEPSDAERFAADLAAVLDRRPLTTSV
jgi:DNA-binding transcriptional MocR family regulator